MRGLLDRRDVPAQPFDQLHGLAHELRVARLTGPDQSSSPTRTCPSRRIARSAVPHATTSPPITATDQGSPDGSSSSR
jgi:hypothetical protein